MHINVEDILAESVGYNREYKIAGENPKLETVRLTKDIEGEVTISRLDASLLVRGRVQTAVELECHRCLSTFNRSVNVGFQQSYAQKPSDEELPITGGKIDLVPVLEQEINLSLPIKILCRPDCPGIIDAPEQYTKEDTPSRLMDRARITKGSQRGRT